VLIIAFDRIIAICIIATVSTATSPAAILDALAPLLAHHRRRWVDACRAHGLSLLGFGALSLLEMHEAMTMSQLADALGVALPNATGIVNRLEERGLLERHDDPSDRRLVRVELTDGGRRLIGDLEAARRERMSHLIAELDPAQRDRLLQCAIDLRGASTRLAEREA
jgi:DNA-binding MarR family transcriptional regulator